MNHVSMLIPCSVDLFFPEIGESMFSLLRRLGETPIYREQQTCCGKPAFGAGYRKHAKKAAKHLIRIFENDDLIVCPSGSCVHTVKHHYTEILKDEPEWLRKTERIASNLFEFSQYIVDHLKIEDVGTVFDGKVAYHESCTNLRRLGISEQPKKLIDGVKGTELLPLNGSDVCCGFGGDFSINFPSISEVLVKEKTEHFLDSGADVLILSEPGCLLNINGYLDRFHPEKKAMHLANFLAQHERKKGHEDQNAPI